MFKLSHLLKALFTTLTLPPVEFWPVIVILESLFKNMESLRLF